VTKDDRPDLGRRRRRLVAIDAVATGKAGTARRERAPPCRTVTAGKNPTITRAKGRGAKKLGSEGAARRSGAKVAEARRSWPSNGVIWRDTASSTPRGSPTAGRFNARIAETTRRPASRA